MTAGEKLRELMALVPFVRVFFCPRCGSTFAAIGMTFCPVCAL